MRKLILFFSILLTITSLNAQKDWKLSVQLWTFHKFTFLQAIEKADSLGFKYVEAYPGQKVGGRYNGPFSYNLSKDERSGLKNLLKSKGIRVIAYGVVDNGYYTKDNLEEYFIFCKDMEIPFMTAEPEWADLDRFNQLAGDYKIKVALHCHPKPTSHYWHPDSMIKAMNGRKNIGAWPDMGHWGRNGVNTVEGLKKIAGKLWGLHFKDVNKFDDTGAVDTLYGRGVSNLSGVLKELKQQHFKGVISFEYEANEDNNMDDMRKNIEFYKSRLRKL
jgi:sugar phosphate isomerase/epimerase